jgi:hypothetical protein
MTVSAARAPRRVSLRLPGVGEFAAAVLLGVGIALSLALLSLVAKLTHVSPLPAPLAVAFAEHLIGKATLGMRLWIPIGLALHLAYVTGATVTIAAITRALGPCRLNLGSSLAAALGLWILAGLIFMPLSGWGFFGTGLGLPVLYTILATHVLYGIFLWGGLWLAYRDSPPTGWARQPVASGAGNAPEARGPQSRGRDHRG